MRTFRDADGGFRTVPCDHDTFMFCEFRHKMDVHAPPFPLTMVTLRVIVWSYAQRLLSP